MLHPRNRNKVSVVAIALGGTVVPHKVRGEGRSQANCGFIGLGNGFRFYSKCSARPPKSLDRRATNLIKVRKVFWWRMDLEAAFTKESCRSLLERW